MFIKQLATPVVITSDFGTITLTHEAYQYYISGVDQPFIKVTSFQGCMVQPPDIKNQDGTTTTPDKVFKPYSNSQNEKVLAIADIKNLIAPDAKGKKANDFRISDALTLARGGVII